MRRTEHRQQTIASIMGSGPSPSHVGDLNDPTPAPSPASSPSEATAAGLRTDSSQEFEPRSDGAAIPPTPAKRVLSYSKLQKRSVPRAESILSAESDVASPPRSIPIKRRISKSWRPSPYSNKRCVTRAMVNGKKDIDYDMKHHPMDDLLHPKAAAKRSVKSKSLNPSPLPERGCITRAMVNGNKNVDYDMKYHPIDDLLRPNAVKKSSYRARASSASTITAFDGPLSRREKSPMPKNLENPFAKPIPKAWDDLEPLDRRVYIIQRGAPSKGNTLPHQWPKLVSMLVKDHYFTREQFNTWGGIHALEERYERVRVLMMTLFDAPEEPMDEEGFVLRYSEEFDVYDLQPRATKGDDAQPSSAGCRRTDLISHGSEGVADEELTIEFEDNHYANNENPENAERMTNEFDIDGIEIDDLHRYDLYGMTQDYVDGKHDDETVPQSQIAGIGLSDGVSLHASSIGQDNHSAEKLRNSSGIAEHTDHEMILQRELVDQEVSGCGTRRTATKRSKQRAFDVFEDSVEPGSAGRWISAVQPISNDLDPPKENFVERGELEVEAVTEQLFHDLSNATQQHHRSLTMQPDTSPFPGNRNLHLPQQADLSTQSLPGEGSRAIFPQDHSSIITHNNGLFSGPDVGSPHSQHTEPNSSMRNGNINERKSTRPTASDYF